MAETNFEKKLDQMYFLLVLCFQENIFYGILVIYRVRKYIIEFHKDVFIHHQKSTAKSLYSNFPKAIKHSWCQWPHQSYGIDEVFYKLIEKLWCILHVFTLGKLFSFCLKSNVTDVLQFCYNMQQYSISRQKWQMHHYKTLNWQ